jgi:hypothetical protein
MARRLATIARQINEQHEGFTASIRRVEVSTDRKIGRLRWPGKGRRGNELTVVHDETGVVLLCHNSAETYRRNIEVERWLDEFVNDRIFDSFNGWQSVEEWIAARAKR